MTINYLVLNSIRHVPMSLLNFHSQGSPSQVCQKKTGRIVLAEIRSHINRSQKKDVFVLTLDLNTF